MTKMNMLLTESKSKKAKNDARYFKSIVALIIVFCILAIFLGIYIHFGYAIGIFFLLCIIMIISLLRLAQTVNLLLLELPQCLHH